MEGRLSLEHHVDFQYSKAQKRYVSGATCSSIRMIFLVNVVSSIQILQKNSPPVHWYRVNVVSSIQILQKKKNLITGTVAQDIYFRLLCPLFLAPPELASGALHAGGPHPFFGHGSRAFLGHQNFMLIQYPIGSMYGIYSNIYHQYTPNVSIYTIHGSYGYGIFFMKCKWENRGELL